MWDYGEGGAELGPAPDVTGWVGGAIHLSGNFMVSRFYADGCRRLPRGGCASIHVLSLDRGIGEDLRVWHMFGKVRQAIALIAGPVSKGFNVGHGGCRVYVYGAFWRGQWSAES